MLVKFLYGLLNLILFVVIFKAIIIVAPYYLTSEKYNNERGVNEHFPVVIEHNNNVRIVEWNDFKKMQGSKLFIPTATKPQVIDGDGSTIKIDNKGIISVTEIKPYVMLYSEYKIKNGVLKPKYFHATGLSTIGYSLIVSIIILYILRIYLVVNRYEGKNYSNITKKST